MMAQWIGTRPLDKSDLMGWWLESTLNELSDGPLNIRYTMDV